jgi:hypothetical protein
MKQRFEALFFGGLLAPVLFGIAAAGQLDDGQAAIERGDYTTAMRLLGPLAEQGDAKALYKLGWMYDNGQGVAQDYAQALVWPRTRLRIPACLSSLTAIGSRHRCIGRRRRTLAGSTPARAALSSPLY